MIEDAAPPDQSAITLDEFARMREDDLYRLELVRGEVVREPRPGAEHGRLLIRIGSELHRFVEERDLGVVLGDVGVRLASDPPIVRGPDLAFVAAARLPASGVPEGFLEAAPDLAVEIVSPRNSATEIQDRVLDYLEAGTRTVWVVDPRGSRVTVHRSRDDIRILTLEAGDVLEGDDVVKGFRLPLQELFGG